ncbi:PIN domain-containing protein [Runella sp. CRIBMP]|nr:PIN domain-containing protein [Runella sp. CRIBMP]
MEIQYKPNKNSSERQLLKQLLDQLVIFEINEQIKNLAIKTRLSTSLKLMDSIIVATAQWINLPLVSSETKFKSASLVDIVLLSNRKTQ